MISVKKEKKNGFMTFVKKKFKPVYITTIS